MQVRHQIGELAARYNRDPDSIRLLAVSKTRGVNELTPAIREHQVEFGENYVQEAVEKIALLQQHPELIWHFIGAVQSNKTRLIAEHFDWVHSVDRLKIAQRLSDQRPATLPPLNVLIQVNVSHESSKSGIDKDQLRQLATDIESLPGLCLRGIMGLPAPATEFEVQRQQCLQLASLYKQVQEIASKADTLSMGTSNDFEAAISAGSTLLRIGTAIFGKRV